MLLGAAQPGAEDRLAAEDDEFRGWKTKYDRSRKTVTRTGAAANPIQTDINPRSPAKWQLPNVLAEDCHPHRTGRQFTFLSCRFLVFFYIHVLCSAGYI